MPVTTAQLKKLFPGAKAALLAAVVNGWGEAEAAGISTPKRVALFFANIGTETGGLTTVSENLNYTTTAALLRAFKGRIKTEAQAKQYLRQPQKLANFVYGSRLGNQGGDDGWAYRGGGMMQTTGRENYAALGFEDHPEWLRDPAIAFSTAVREWEKRGCNGFADRGDVVGCRKVINGGTNGLAEVKAYYAKALTIFGAASSSRPAPARLFTPPVEEDEVTPVESGALVRLVQQQLREKGYFEVGNADGIYGNRTRDAIMSFESDSDLEPTGLASGELLAKLADAPHRPVSDERATATASDLKGSKSIDIATQIKTIGAGALGVSGLGGAISIEDAISKYQSITSALKSVSPYVIGVVVSAVVIYFGQRIIREQVKAFREGRHV